MRELVTEATSSVLPITRESPATRTLLYRFAVAQLLRLTRLCQGNPLELTKNVA